MKQWLSWWLWRRWRIYCPSYKVSHLFIKYPALVEDIYGKFWSPCSIHPVDKAPIQFLGFDLPLDRDKE